MRQYKDCAHAVGHELRAKVLGSNEQVVALCNNFAPNYRSACASGVFMESSKGNNGFGHHSDGAVGQIIFDCTKVAENYKHTCYASLGSYKQYEANSEPWQETFKFCASLPDIYKNDCFAGADERLLMALGGDNRQIEKICNFLLFEEKNGCLMTQKMSLNSLQ